MFFLILLGELSRETLTICPNGLSAYKPGLSVADAITASIDHSEFDLRLHRFVCDELDGRFARMLNQSSKFGAVLDMITDRYA